MSALAEVAQRVLTGSGTPRELLDALLTATVLCDAPAQPGVVPARTADGRDVVCIHTSLAQLAAARGPVPWFATTGRDLLGLLPPGHDLLLDPASPHAVLLRVAALRRAVEVA